MLHLQVKSQSESLKITLPMYHFGAGTKPFENQETPVPKVDPSLQKG